MSTLIGTESERWSLSRAIDALSDSARQAGHPGIVWLAGFVYTVIAGLGFGWNAALAYTFQLSIDNAQESLPGKFLHVLRVLPAGALIVVPFVPFCGLFLLPFFRLTIGLARIGPALAWQRACGDRRTPPIRSVWAAGKGLSFGSFGLWVQLALMVLGAVLLGSLPIAALARVVEGPVDDIRSAGLLGAALVPILLILFGYVMILSVLNQFALHSLAHNRRGVYSALLHGWRIMRNDGWATARAVLVDLLLFATVATIWGAVSEMTKFLGETGLTIAAIVKLVLTGFAGVTRAGYWARAYRALGGLSPDDGVPGL